MPRFLPRGNFRGGAGQRPLFPGWSGAGRGRVENFRGRGGPGQPFPPGPGRGGACIPDVEYVTVTIFAFMSQDSSLKGGNNMMPLKPMTVLITLKVNSHHDFSFAPLDNAIQCLHGFSRRLCCYFSPNYQVIANYGIMKPKKHWK